MQRATRNTGFTLVEILIVVVILGILAAIVIPQFTNASEDAKASSLFTQLQTIRSQLELYQVQHNGNYPAVPANDATNGGFTWTPMTAAASGLGPYLQQAPKNPFGSDPDDWATHWGYNPDTGELYPVLTDAQATAAGFASGQYVTTGGDLSS